MFVSGSFCSWLDIVLQGGGEGTVTEKSKRNSNCRTVRSPMGRNNQYVDDSYFGANTYMANTEQNN
jgi:hypothetical protein